MNCVSLLANYKCVSWWNICCCWGPITAVWNLDFQSFTRISHVAQGEIKLWIMFTPVWLMATKSHLSPTRAIWTSFFVPATQIHFSHQTNETNTQVCEDLDGESLLVSSEPVPAYRLECICRPIHIGLSNQHRHLHQLWPRKYQLLCGQRNNTKGIKNFSKPKAFDGCRVSPPAQSKRCYFQVWRPGGIQLTPSLPEEAMQRLNTAQN